MSSGFLAMTEREIDRHNTMKSVPEAPKFKCWIFSRSLEAKRHLIRRLRYY